MASDLNHLAEKLMRGKQARAGEPPAQRRGSTAPTLRLVALAVAAALAWIISQGARP